MTEAERQYADIIHLSRPQNADIMRRHPRMRPEERAKIFAPFSALRGLNERLDEENKRYMGRCRTV